MRTAARCVASSKRSSGPLARAREGLPFPPVRHRGGRGAVEDKEPRGHRSGVGVSDRAAAARGESQVPCWLSFALGFPS